MSTESRTSGISVVFMLAGLLLVFVASVMAMVSYKVGFMPWELLWIDDGSIASPVWMIIMENINEFAALGVSTLLFALYGLIGMRMDAAASRASDIRDLEAEPEQELDEQQLDPVADESAESVADDPAIAEPVVRLAPANKAMESQLQIALSEVTRLKRDLVVSRRETESAEKVKAQFLSNMSHELRTPMNGIIGMTDLLLEEKLSERQRHFAQSINASSESLLNVINDLLDYSRIESGDMQLDKARFDLGACVEDVCSVLAAPAQSKGVELICYVDDDMPKYVDGDAARLRQVINNLVTNSIAFTEDGEIVVRVSKLESTDTHHVFQCDVQDTGAGIAPEMQVKLFESFKQADQSSSREHGGLGIGLAITSQLVKLMDGDVSFRSRLGEGTRFTFTAHFKRVADEDAGKTGMGDVSDATVLIVDDNATNRSILYHQVAGWGFQAEMAESGPHALEIMKKAAADEKCFDAMILDLHMPGMDGIELTREIRKVPAIAKTKAMMLTSAIVEISSEEMRALRIDTYISKPARQSQLRECLRDLIFSDSDSPSLNVLPGDRAFTRDALEGAPVKVLLVEDDVVNLDVANSMLNGLNCIVTQASDGLDAVNLARDNAFDIIFMDCQLPVLDGFSASSRIKGGRGQNAHTPIVALTANAMPGDRDRCIDAGMQDYISKPMRQAQLAKVLDKWVSNTRLENAPHKADINQPDITLGVAARETDKVVPVTDKPSATAANDAGANSIADAQDAGANPIADAQDAADDQSIINTKAIDKIRELQRPGKDDILSKVVNLFFAKTPDQLAELQQAVESQDYAAVKAVVHGMKSSSAYLGAEQLASCCAEVETLVREDNTDKVATLAEEIVEQYKRVETELQQFVKAA